MAKQKVAIGDMAVIKKLGSLTLSPSGKKAAFTVLEGCMEKNNYATDIWVYDEDRTPALFRLTAGDDGASPMFLDEETVLFPSDRKKKHPATPTQKFTTFNTISLNGGEANEAFFLPFEVPFIYNIGDGLWLCGGRRDVSLPDVTGLDECEKAKVFKELEEDKDYTIFDELPYWFNGKGVTNKKRTGLFLCNTKTGVNELLTDLYFDVTGLVLNADKTRAAYWGYRFETYNQMKSVMYLRDLATGATVEVPLNGKYNVSDGAFAGEDLLFTATDGAKYGTSQNDDIFKAAPDGSFEMILSPDITFGPVGSDIAGGGSHWAGNDAWYFLQTDNFRSVYKKLTADGKMTLLADRFYFISAAAGKDHLMYLIDMEKVCPQELYIKKNGVTTCVSAFNSPYMESHETAHTEHFTFLDREGSEIDGWVLYPADYDPSKTYPGILSVHGGPRVAYGEGFFHEFQYWAACGYIIFFCNPRGSCGKGDVFADIMGDNYGIRDFNCLMDFTDEVLKRVPRIDPSRIAMTGGSYGGFMANWIIGHTDRFAAVVSCRSIANYISKCLTTDIGYYHNMSQVGADPWTAPEKMWAHSPLAYADKVKTPTLFIQSDEDYRCWMADPLQMMQALLMHGVPTKMCLFHGENHELSRSGKPKHRVRRLKEMTAWFDKYLGVER